MKYISYIKYLILISLFTSSCVPPTSTPTPTHTETTVEVTPTITMTPTWTFVPPTSSPTITPTSMRTTTPTPTFTLTPPATLEPEQAEALIKTLMREPVDCGAPCFWNITPGKTTFGEANNIYIALGFEALHTNSRGNIKHYEINYDFDNGSSIKHLLTTLNDIVQNARIYITPEEQRAGYPREWLAYSPETLINRYGLPSKVEIIVDWGPSSFLEINMYFNTYDLVVEYSGYDIIPRKPGSPIICPLTSQFESVRVWMGENPINLPLPAIPLEEAASLTIEEFSKLMTGDPDSACFQINGEVFR